MYDAEEARGSERSVATWDAGREACDRFCERCAIEGFQLEPWRDATMFSGSDRTLVVHGFDPDTDKVRVCAKLAGDFDALRTLARESADRVRFDFFGGRTLDLMNVRLTDLDDRHFQFVDKK